MEIVDIIGYGAAFLTTVAFFPQFMKVIKTKSTKDISLITFIAFSLGVFLWLVYGIWIQNKAIIAANMATLFLAIGILYFKFRYG